MLNEGNRAEWMAGWTDGHDEIAYGLLRNADEVCDELRRVTVHNHYAATPKVWMAGYVAALACAVGAL